MAHITLHKIKNVDTPEDMQEREQHFIPNKVKQAANKQPDCDGTLYFCRTYIFGSFLLGIVHKDATKRALQLILQTCTAEVQMNVTTSENIVRQIQNTRVELPVSPSLHITTSVWYDAFYYALITRAKKTLAELRKVNYEMKFVEDSMYSVFKQAHYKFLRDLGTNFEKANYYSAERALEAIPVNYRGYYNLYFKLWGPIVEKDETAFNKLLLELLEGYKKYWGRSTNNRNNDYIGWSSPELTAIMAYALDKGFTIEHSSDYTPVPLVQGDFNVDIDTKFDFVF